MLKNCDVINADFIELMHKHTINMRVTKFMKEHGISFETMVKISQFLKWEELKPNTKLSDEEADVFLQANCSAEFNSRIKEFKGAEPVKKLTTREEFMKYEGYLDDFPEGYNYDEGIVKDYDSGWQPEDDYEKTVMNSFENGTSDLYGF